MDNIDKGNINDPNIGLVVNWYVPLEGPAGEQLRVDGKLAFDLNPINPEGFNAKDTTEATICSVVMNYSEEAKCFLLEVDDERYISEYLAAAQGAQEPGAEIAEGAAVTKKQGAYGNAAGPPRVAKRAKGNGDVAK